MLCEWKDGLEVWLMKSKCLILSFMPQNKHGHEMNKHEHTISRYICKLQKTFPIISGFVKSVSLDKDTNSYLSYLMPSPVCFGQPDLTLLFEAGMRGCLLKCLYKSKLSQTTGFNNNLSHHNHLVMLTMRRECDMLLLRFSYQCRKKLDNYVR